MGFDFAERESRTQFDFGVRFAERTQLGYGFHADKASETASAQIGFNCKVGRARYQAGVRMGGEQCQALLKRSRKVKVNVGQFDAERGNFRRRASQTFPKEISGCGAERERGIANWTIACTSTKIAGSGVRIARASAPWPVMLCEQAHHKARCAITALRATVINHRLLYW